MKYLSQPCQNGNSDAVAPAFDLRIDAAGDVKILKLELYDNLLLRHIAFHAQLTDSAADLDILL